MIKLLLIVIGCYLFVALMVHVYYAIAGQRQNKNRHYILLADHSTEHIEWYYRSMRKFSAWMGIPVQLTIVQAQPTVELVQMVDCWSRLHQDIHFTEQVRHATERDIIVDLSRKDDLWKLPF